MDWQAIIVAAVLAALLNSVAPSLLPRVVSGARASASWLSNRFGQWWSGFASGASTALVGTVIVLAVGGSLPSLPAWSWPDWLTWTTEDTIPSPAKGFRVLFVSESGTKVTSEQIHALNSSTIAAYLNEKCVKADGHPEWRRWDKDVDTTHESQVWRDLWDAAKPKIDAQSLPCVVIATDRNVQIYPVTTEAETLALLKRYGG